MLRLLAIATLLAPAIAPAQVAPRDSATDTSAASAPAPSPVLPRDTVVPADSILRPRAPLVEPPAVVRGLYVNRWAALGQKMWQLIDVAKRTEVNALVVDVKDDRGYVLYRSRVPLARQIGADTIMPMSAARLRAVLDTMRAHGIYPIARIVVAKDPLLAQRKLAWAIRRKDDPTKPWLDKNGNPWLDPHQAGVWLYAADLAAEAIALGFSEVQLDYVRFPDERRMVREAVFPLAKGRSRADVIREQLGTVRARLAPFGVPFTIDVFGLTTSDTTDMGIGQRWEQFVDRADAVLPMTYPSHYGAGSYGIRSPNAQPYQVIDRALEDAKRRSAGIVGAARVIPWYQDFTLGPPRYGPAQLRAQMQAGYDNGIYSWILWNPRSVYTLAALKEDGLERDSSMVRAQAAADSAARSAPPAERGARADSARKD